MTVTALLPPFGSSLIGDQHAVTVINLRDTASEDFSLYEGHFPVSLGFRHSVIMSPALC